METDAMIHPDPDQTRRFLAHVKKCLKKGRKREIAALGKSGRSLVAWIAKDTDLDGVVSRIVDDGRNWYIALNDVPEGTTGHTDKDNVCHLSTLGADWDSIRDIPPDAKGHKVACMATETERQAARVGSKPLLSVLQHKYGLTASNFCAIMSGSGIQYHILIDHPYDPAAPVLKPILTYLHHLTRDLIDASRVTLTCLAPTRPGSSGCPAPSTARAERRQSAPTRWQRYSGYQTRPKFSTCPGYWRMRWRGKSQLIQGGQAAQRQLSERR